MASAGGREVGRVSIRVVPDTKNFRKDLLRELRKIERTVSFKVHAELDSKGMAKRFRDQVAHAASQIPDVKIGGAFDERVADELEESVKRARTLRDMFRGMGGQVGKVRLAWTKMRTDIVLASDKISEFRKGIQSIKQANLDSSGTAKFFKGLSKGNFLDTGGIGRFRTSLIGLQATIKGFSNLGKSSFKSLGRRVLDMDLRFRRTQTTVKVLGKSMASGFKVGGKVLKGIAGLATLGATGFGELSRHAKIFVAILAAAPAILGLVAALIGGLPSLMAALGAAAIVVALGMDGIKAAFKTFGESLKPLKAEISSVFEKGLAPQLAKITTLLNGMKPGLKSIANGLLDMSGAMIDAVTSGQGLKDVNDIVSNTGKFFSDLAPFMKTFTQGFLTLGAEGSRNFGLLTTTLTRFGEKWKEFATRVSENGTLKGALEGLNKVLDSLLQGFIKLTEAGLGEMMRLGAPLADALSGIIDVIVAVLPILGVLAEVILIVVKALADALLPIVKALQPVFQQIGQIIATALVPVITALAPGLEALALFAGDLFVALSPLFPILAEIGKVIAGVVMAALNALRPVLPVIATAMQKVAEVINGGLARGMPILQDIATTLGTALVDAINTIAPLLPGMIQAFMDLVIAVLPLLPPLLRLIGEILPPLLEIYMRLYPAVMSLVTAFVNFLVPILNDLIDIIADVVGWLGQFADDIASAGEGVVRWFKDLPGNIWDAVSGAGGWLWDTGAAIIQGLWDGLGQKWREVRRWFDDRVNEIKDIFARAMGIASPSKVFMSYGRDIMAGLTIGLGEAAPEALKSVRDVANEISGVGSDMSAAITAEGGIEMFGTGLKDDIITALEGWQVAQNSQGTFNMNRTATRDNKYGR